MAIRIILILIILVAALALFIASRSNDFFRVTRTVLISAPLSIVYDQVNNLKLWGAWSPWDRMDPKVVNSFDGPEQGVGASAEWVGPKLGAGKMTITESRAAEFIRMRLEFFKPMQGVSTTDFTFTPEGNQTRVTWSMFGKNNFMAKAMSLVMNCDKMVGTQFEQGLAALKTISESKTQ